MRQGGMHTLWLPFALGPPGALYLNGWLYWRVFAPGTPAHALLLLLMLSSAVAWVAVADWDGF